MWRLARLRFGHRIRAVSTATTRMSTARSAVAVPTAHRSVATAATAARATTTAQTPRGGGDRERAVSELKNRLRAAVRHRRIEEFASVYRELGSIGPEYIDTECQILILTLAKRVGDPRAVLKSWRMIRSIAGPHPPFELYREAIHALVTPHVIVSPTAVDTAIGLLGEVFRRLNMTPPPRADAPLAIAATTTAAAASADADASTQEPTPFEYWTDATVHASIPILCRRVLSACARVGVAPNAEPESATDKRAARTATATDKRTHRQQQRLQFVGSQRRGIKRVALVLALLRQREIFTAELCVEAFQMYGQFGALGEVYGLWEWVCTHTDDLPRSTLVWTAAITAFAECSDVRMSLTLLEQFQNSETWRDEVAPALKHDATHSPDAIAAAASLRRFTSKLVETVRTAATAVVALPTQTDENGDELVLDRGLAKPPSAAAPAPDSHTPPEPEAFTDSPIAGTARTPQISSASAAGAPTLVPNHRRRAVAPAASGNASASPYGDAQPLLTASAATTTATAANTTTTDGEDELHSLLKSYRISDEVETAANAKAAAAFATVSAPPATATAEPNFPERGFIRTATGATIYPTRVRNRLMSMYGAVLNACSRAGLAGLAIGVFEEMAGRHGIAPDRRHYSALLQCVALPRGTLEDATDERVDAQRTRQFLERRYRAYQTLTAQLQSSAPAAPASVPPPRASALTLVPEERLARSEELAITRESFFSQLLDQTDPAPAAAATAAPAATPATGPVLNMRSLELLSYLSPISWVELYKSWMHDPAASASFLPRSVCSRYDVFQRHSIDAATVELAASEIAAPLSLLVFQRWITAGHNGASRDDTTAAAAADSLPDASDLDRLIASLLYKSHTPRPAVADQSNAMNAMFSPNPAGAVQWRPDSESDHRKLLTRPTKHHIAVALQVVDWMAANGRRPSEAVCGSILNACREARTVPLTKVLLTRMKAHNVKVSASFYLDFFHRDFLRRYLVSRETDPVSGKPIVSAGDRIYGWDEFVSLVFGSMKDFGVSFNDEHARRFFRLCLFHGRMGLHMSAISDVIDRLLRDSVPVSLRTIEHAMVALIQTQGWPGFQLARSIFRRLHEFTPVDHHARTPKPVGATHEIAPPKKLSGTIDTYNILLTGSSLHDVAGESLSLWNELKRLSTDPAASNAIHPSEYSYAVILKVLLSKPPGDLPAAIEIARDMKRGGIEFSSERWDKLVAFITAGHTHAVGAAGGSGSGDASAAAAAASAAHVNTVSAAQRIHEIVSAISGVLWPDRRVVDTFEAAQLKQRAAQVARTAAYAEYNRRVRLGLPTAHLPDPNAAATDDSDSIFDRARDRERIGRAGAGVKPV